ncbi:hypothetical protein NAEGRDRAFT_78768 [Naegleria gruberi]|uniref:Uncharacterized protein n=1 Tax=Naegleria gruberi TaxID=5762 RepID=D2V6D3_NAEGR|nr:uncharacterized protein NAEGRDRAFT_78768 [Naegleria gruberi]EFC47551.1 hypothetical protein NAEGRDRAFT_78768 [Naegleria gruberi]|eukprot:XP_002680295.1 hypothetical protein NAEGRDRAFT_78768 [Naegleria gruberi strain NEG-M]
MSRIKNLLLCDIFLLVVIALTVNSVKSYQIDDCPLYWRLFSNTSTVSNTNYTKLMIENWEEWYCESIPNTLFDKDIYYGLDGAALSDWQYNVLFIRRESLFCEKVKVDESVWNVYERAINHYSNISMMKEWIIPHLEKLVLENPQNIFQTPRPYFLYEFDKQVSNDGTTFLELVNAFNYLLYCKRNNSNFEIFHKEWLPNMVTQSNSTKVQTLNVLFGDNVKSVCGRNELTLLNRTQLCLCSNGNQFETLSSFECESAFVTFWVPLGGHLSLKIIELVIYLIQLVSIIFLIFIPISFQYCKNWKYYIHRRRNTKYIKKNELEGVKNSQNVTNQISLKDENNLTPRGLENSIKEKSENSGVKENQETIPEKSEKSQTIVSESQPKKTNVRESLQNIDYELIRVLFDNRLFASICIVLSQLILTVNALLFIVIQGTNGISLYDNYNFTLLVSADCYVTIGNVPLAVLFYEILLKMSDEKKKMSLVGLVTVFIVCSSLFILTVACLCSTIVPIEIQNYIRVICLILTLIALIISWSILFGYSMKIYLLLSKYRKINVMRFKFSQYLLLLIVSISYLLYEMISEFGFATELYVFENLWTILFKHRIGSYVIGFSLWGMTYVLFSKQYFEECYARFWKK